MEPIANTTADPTLEFTELKIGKKIYKLIFDFRALARVEAQTGMSLMLGVHWQSLKLNELHGMLLGTLLKAHPETTAADVSALLNGPRRIRLATDALMVAWAKAYERDEAEEKEENPPEPQPAAA